MLKGDSLYRTVIPAVVELAPAAIGRGGDPSFPSLSRKSLMDSRYLPAGMTERGQTITLLETSLPLIEMLCEMIWFEGDEQQKAFVRVHQPKARCLLISQRRLRLWRRCVAA